jgi:pyrimidine and pyridine-specific 5'-nucleotidase
MFFYIDREVDGRLPLEQILKPDPELRHMLETLPMRKWILTNAGLEVKMHLPR